MDAFLKDLKILHEAQLKRLENIAGAHVAEEVSLKLHQAKLSSADITVATQKELNRISKIKQDSPITCENPRMDGYGWTATKMKSHMEQFVKELFEKQRAIYESVTK